MINFSASLRVTPSSPTIGPLSNILEINSLEVNPSHRLASDNVPYCKRTRTISRCLEHSIGDSVRISRSFSNCSRSCRHLRPLSMIPWRAVSPLSPVLEFGFAPAAMRSFTTSRCPNREASYSALYPKPSCPFTFTPSVRSFKTMVVLPEAAAVMRSSTPRSIEKSGDAPEPKSVFAVSWQLSSPKRRLRIVWRGLATIFGLAPFFKSKATTSGDASATA
ncbi:hypothetical protein F4677DRAFT_121102 [Hypoxylon crocopeplum]|nr:hypothetical protein F4677DRAFT_121102 [Hypoxylon crocopeplum]